MAIKEITYDSTIIIYKKKLIYVFKECAVATSVMSYLLPAACNLMSIDKIAFEITFYV